MAFRSLVLLLITAVALLEVGAGVKWKPDSNWPSLRCHPEYRANRHGLLANSFVDCHDEDNGTPAECLKHCILHDSLIQMGMHSNKTGNYDLPNYQIAKGNIREMILYEFGKRHSEKGLSPHVISKAETMAQELIAQCDPLVKKRSYNENPLKCAEWEPIFQCFENAVKC